jgi:hypothetical protein
MRMGERIKVRSSPCTACGVVLDCASIVHQGNSTQPAMPKPGNITICIKCGHIMGFRDDLTLRDLTDEEAHKVAGDIRLRAIQWARGRVGAGK